VRASGVRETDGTRVKIEPIGGEADGPLV